MIKLNGRHGSRGAGMTVFLLIAVGVLATINVVAALLHQPLLP